MSTKKEKTVAKATKNPEKISVKIYLAKSKSALKAGILANASVTLYGSFAVRLVVRKGHKGGLWVTMPSQKGSDGEYYDVFFPVTANAREVLTNAVIEAYEQVTFDEAEDEYDLPF